MSNSTLQKILASVRRHPRFNLEQISKDCSVPYETVRWHFKEYRQQFKEALVEARAIQKQQANANAVADGGWPPYPSEY